MAIHHEIISYDDRILTRILEKYLFFLRLFVVCNIDIFSLSSFKKMFCKSSLCHYPKTQMHSTLNMPNIFRKWKSSFDVRF